MALKLNLLKTKWQEIIASRTKYKKGFITWSEHKKEKKVIELKYTPEEAIYAKETITRTKIAKQLKIAIPIPIITEAIKTSLNKNKPIAVLLTKPETLLTTSKPSKPTNYILYIIGIGIGLYLIKKV